jgi:hypothetical protein
MNLIDRLFKTETGGIILSIIFGLAIPTLFRRVCSDDKCVVIKSNTDEIKKNIYREDGVCYRFSPKLLKCKSKSE